MSLLLFAMAVLQDADLERWVRDLGSDDYAAREKADQELRKIGAPAIPALRKVLEDKDAERAFRARNILEELERREKPKAAPPLVRTRTSFRDLPRGITFDQFEDGRVELTVPEVNKETGKKEYKTYKAASMDEFKEKHPEVAREYRVEEFGGRRLDLREFRRKLEEKWFEDPSVPQDPEKLFEWFDRQRRRRAPVPRPEPVEPRPAFGIRIEPVGETLAAQLELAEGEGALVGEVKPGSLAERSGLKRYDVITKFNGAPAADPAKLRGEILGMIEKGFTLEIIRKGKRETITVKP